jgi:hypothetical protein
MIACQRIVTGLVGKTFKFPIRSLALVERPLFSSSLENNESKLFSTSTQRFSPAELKFDVSRFNDIHVRANNISQYNQDINSNMAEFESALKGIVIRKTYRSFLKITACN